SVRGWQRGSWSRQYERRARSTRELQALEILSEGLIDDLGVGEAVEVSLPPDRLDPALFDVEGDTLGLAAGITGLFQGRLAGLPPGSEFLKDGEQTDKHILVNRRCVVVGQRGPSGRIGTFLSGCSHGRLSKARVYTRCTPKHTEVYNRCTEVYKGIWRGTLDR